MMILRSVIHKLITLSVLILLVSCASQKPIQDERHTIDVTSFSVVVPTEGGWEQGWEIATDREKDRVTFQKPKKWWTGQVLGSTRIQILRNDVLPQRWQHSQDEIADDYRNNEERNMKEEGVKKDTFKLLDVKKSIETIYGMKLYAMYYETETDVPGGFAQHGLNAYRHQEAMLYLYFPPDFKDKHIFFQFIINEDCQKGSMGCRVDLTQIYPVINSFRVKGTVTK